jgi:hypothetical protein
MEFQPFEWPERDIFELLLLRLFQLNICCHLSGSFETCAAGVFQSYSAAMLYLTITDNHFVNLFLQKGPIDIEDFYFDEFHFRLVDKDPLPDSCYNFSKGDFKTKLNVIGIDTSSPCFPFSNVDFVHFIWQNFEQFTLKIYSITSLPSEVGSQPKMSYLKYHRTKSYRWRDNARCLTCKLDYRRIMQNFTLSTLPAYSTCNICLRQPPSLLASASHIVFNHVLI